MKKLMLVLALLAGFISVSARNQHTRDVNVLPTSAQTTIKNNFKAEISHIKIEKEWGKVSEYEVVLTDGTEITFDRNGNWKEVEVSRNKSVPAFFVPTAISSYVKQTQKNQKITGIEKERGGYTVELSNDVEMKFNSKGQFLRFD